MYIRLILLIAFCWLTVPQVDAKSTSEKIKSSKTISVKKTPKAKLKKASAKKKKASPKKKIITHHTHSKTNPSEEDRLKDIVTLASSKRMSDAEKLVKKCSDKKLAADILYIMKVYYEPQNLKLSEIANFFAKNRWVPFEPFSPRVEKAISHTSSANDVHKIFQKHEPVSNRGKLLLLNTLIELKHVSKHNKAIQQNLRQLWISTEMELEGEEYFLKKYKDIITVEDLLKKVEFLTWEASYINAAQILSLIPEKYAHLPKTRLEIARVKLKHRRTIENLPNDLLNDDFLQYALIKNLIKEKNEEQTLSRLLKVKPKVQYERWWKLKNIAIRDALKNKQYKEAYKLTLNHNLENGADFAEAEWLGGWISLRFLKDSNSAIQRFSTLYNNTRLANSRSKAAYWLARAHEQAGNTSDASKWYETAGTYKGTFYGHLGIAAIGIQGGHYFENANNNTNEPDNKEDFKKLARLITFLNGANVKILSNKLVQETSNRAKSNSTLTNMAQYFVTKKQHDMAVELARTAANSGAPLIKHGFPSHISVSNSTLPKSFYLSIIRQESGFNPNAKSTAGASGLMQLMPATAAKVAKDLGLKRNAYLKSPAQNVKHGVKYFDQLFAKYSNLPMSIAAYNAGPGNVNKWITRYGDPRKNCDLYCTLDWIESIPFSETRNYVRKVIENYVIYDSLLDKAKHHPKAIVSFVND